MSLSYPMGTNKSFVAVLRLAEVTISESLFFGGAMNFYSASVALLWTTAMGFSAPATARDPDSVQATVSLRDVDLETVAGKTQALKRITATARRLCNQFGNTSRVADRETRADCVRDAVADATGRANQFERLRRRDSMD
jgi:UrcA family protein